MNVFCLYDELMPVALLKQKFNPNNTNTHPDEQIARLAAIMTYQGVRHPAKVSKLSGLIVGGHGRVLAAIKNGWDVFPVNFQDYENDTQEMADVTSDNAISNWSTLDLSMINRQLADMGPDQVQRC